MIVSASSRQATNRVARLHRMDTSNPRIVDEIMGNFAARGGRHYGEQVTELQHALQCATFAERTRHRSGRTRARDMRLSVRGEILRPRMTRMNTDKTNSIHSCLIRVHPCHPWFTSSCSSGSTARTPSPGSGRPRRRRPSWTRRRNCPSWGLDASSGRRGGLCASRA